MTSRKKYFTILLAAAICNIYILFLYLKLSTRLTDTLIKLGTKDSSFRENTQDNSWAALPFNFGQVNTSSINRIFNLSRSLIKFGADKLTFPEAKIPFNNPPVVIHNDTVLTSKLSNVIDKVKSVPKSKPYQLVADESGSNAIKKKIENALRDINIIKNGLGETNRGSNGKVNNHFLIDKLNISLFLHNSKLHLPPSLSVSDNPTTKKAEETEAGETPFFEPEPFSTRIDFKALQKNPIYAKFRIMEVKKKKRVHILIIVSSAPRRIDRRMAIRNTWWKMCKPTNEVIPACVFRTDFLYPDEKYYTKLQDEASKFNDLTFQHTEEGINFGDRFLNHMLFAVSNYEFSYFLRIDDDYFLCLQNFLNELPLPMEKGLLWGWIHTEPLLFRPDVGIILLSRDLLETFLLQDKRKMLCHPFADQMIGEWSNMIDMKNTYRSDPRLHHHPPARNVIQLKSRKNICHDFIGLHGSYPTQMIRFWKNRGEYRPPTKDLIAQSHVVTITQRYNYKAMEAVWQYKPELCILNPTWDTTRFGDKYNGRQGS